MKLRNKNPGLFIAIEGSDGSGKGTQFKLLVERLKADGYDVAAYDFPQYEHDSSHFVKQYLNGKYGTADALGPYTPSLFYALDRYEASHQMRQDLAAGKIVVSNRYVGSNMAHQATKFSNDEERVEFFKWLEQLEYEMLGIPKPDINAVLLVPAETAQGLIDQKAARDYTNKKRDIHEADLSHLQRAVHCYKLLAATNDSFVAIDCTQNGQMLSIAHIQESLWNEIKSLVKSHSKGAVEALPATSAPAENPYIRKNDNGSYSITSAGRQWLESAVTNVKGSVYLTKDKLGSVTAAAAMARLSRRGDDLRVTVLDEFAQQIDDDSNERGDEALLRRVITAYGDDSVQQLVGQHVVIEGASNILTKKLEWGRLAAYLEQSTRYIFFDQKDEHGKYKYYTPQTFDQQTRDHYEARMDLLFDNYSKLARKLTDYVRKSSNEPEDKRDGAWKAATRAQACDAIRGALPVATKSTVGIYASGQALESLIMHLLSDEHDESRRTGQAILEEARKVIPTFLERADKPGRGGAWVAHKATTRAKLAQIAADHDLQPMKGDDSQPVQLTHYWPKNELAVLPHMLYEQSTLGVKELETIVSEWSYEDKQTTFNAYMGERLNRRHRPGRAMEIAHFSFDLICDYGIFRDLQRHRMVDALEWQALTPHYGFETPDLVAEAGLEDLLEQCFSISLELYHYLLAHDYVSEAQYATLLGHKMRWKLTMNAREAFHFIELRTAPQGHPGYRKLAMQMYEKIAEVHPLTAAAMLFVNKDEDPELTRLAAERATQFKLETLDKKETAPKETVKTTEVN